MTADTEGEGYRYTLSAAEKLHILSESLSSQTFPETGQALIPETGQALTAANGSQAEYESLEGAYAFVMNHRGLPARKSRTPRFMRHATGGWRN